MRSVWFALVGPTVSEVQATLVAAGCETIDASKRRLNYPGFNSVLYIHCDEYEWAQTLGLQEEYNDLVNAIGGKTPTAYVGAHVSGSVPGDAEVRFLAHCLLTRFQGYAFDDFLAYQHAWTLAEIESDAKIDGRRFFDYVEAHRRTLAHDR